VDRQVDIEQLLGEGRAAHARKDWATAYREFLRVHETGGLEAEDLTLLSDAAWWMGRNRECLAWTEEVHQAYLDRDEVERAAMQALQLGGLWMMRGDFAVGSGWVSRARRLLTGRADSPAQGFLRFVDASMSLEERDFEAAVSGALEMQQSGRRFGVPTLTCLGLMVEGMARVRLGEVRAGLGLLDEAMLPVLAEQVEPDWAGNIYCTTMAVCHDLADIARLREWHTVTRQWCEQFSDAVMFLGVCRLHRVQLLSTDGDWAEAEAEARIVCGELADMNASVVAEGEYCVGELHRLRGEHDRAQKAYARARELGREPQPGESLLLLAEGRVQDAWAGVNAALAHVAGDPFLEVRLLRAKVEIGIAGGRTREAGDAASDLQRLSDLFDTPGYRAWSHHMSGAVRLAAGEPDVALALLRRAAQEYQRLRAPYDVARAQELLAGAHRQLGETSLAEAAAASAVATYRRLGAADDVRRAASLQEVPGGLTPREAEVLAHIAAGATNREVAEALFISEKTVGRHLANIFAKLDVGSRTAAASWAHTHGLEPAGRAGPV
jgi:DNA-binding CsgD family transcriptional regulator